MDGVQHQGRNSAWRWRPISSQLTLIILLAASGVAQSQEEERPRTINYSYAAFVGSGLYRLDDRTVGVLRIPFSKRLREPTMEKIGIKALFPVTVGYHDYESDPPHDVDGDSFLSLSFVPGVELQYLARPNWAIKPFANAGVGLEVDDGDTDAIWGFGLRSVARVRRKSPQIYLGAEWLTASNNPDDDDLDDHFTRVGGGIDFRFPLKMTLGDRATSITTHINVFDYVNEVEFGIEGGDFYEIGWTAEIGAALGLDPPLSVLGFTVDRIGLGFRFGEDLRAIVLVRKFPF